MLIFSTNRLFYYIQQMANLILKSSINNSQFGCKKHYFENHIKGKPLHIVKSYSKMVCVEDDRGLNWTVLSGQYVIQTSSL